MGFQRINDDITIGTQSTLLKLILGLFLLYFDRSQIRKKDPTKYRSSYLEDSTNWTSASFS